MMCFEESHQSVNLKENSSRRYLSLSLSLLKTNQRESEREREVGLKAEQNQLLSDGEAGSEEGGLRLSLTMEPAFIRYII